MTERNSHSVQNGLPAVEKKTKRIDVWLPPQMALTLELLAREDRRKLSEYVRVVLEQHIDAVADKQQGE